jgi:ATP-dependent helicase Lhr and Lhr-like helicase
VLKLDDPRLNFLNRLERIESSLLSWGLVDGSFRSDELEKLCDEFLQEQKLWNQYEDEETFLDSMEDLGLLHRITDGMEVRYRTRMAETIRLLARMRQLFPKHLEEGTRRWQVAKPLVGDFRFMLRGRLVPKRNLSKEHVRERLERINKLSTLQEDCLTAILTLPNEKVMELATFQVRASENILRQLASRRRSGTIVCAGTGSGKTLSFYLPAFLSICESIDSQAWTRCLAVYPRNELLKDQLLEAYGQARKLDSILSNQGKRKLTIATFFGATPKNERAFDFADPPRGWKRTHEGDVCPFLPCPSEDCQGQMLWRTEDRKRGNHRLECLKCRRATVHDELILTRERLRSAPADILFTTTEMLNQRIGDSQFSHVFGIGTARAKKPSLVLLDEVHTYAGISGAQTALLLRRWKHATQTSPHFVGLSATLADARTFFAALIGEPDSRVEEIAPHNTELDRVSMEYLLALRGDPASQASLLSSSIQTAMLMRRVLDANTPTAPVSGVYGSKVFVFTDDLDVTNRLFFNLRDAEGQNDRGQADSQRHPGGSLANLRRSNLPDERARNRFGQSWELCESLGHRLQSGSASIQVDRTSSQDAGVAKNADIIVATAALEVGFNDPEVNVVLQHKAPRDAAQFLQRKGRAGRRIEMRPWTLVSLSDYGRDRQAWESFDLLFDPELPPRELPTRNRYVLRMQAVFAFFDWMALELRQIAGLPQGSIYQDFAGPAERIYKDPKRIEKMKERQEASAKIIEGLLFREERFQDLASYLSLALAESEETIETLMWEPPRALMTAALPTLLRRLKTNWRRVGANPAAIDHYVPNNPLPEFVPGQLFGDLNLPEVTLLIPQKHDPPIREPLPILQAMREFAPGRISRRFGIKTSRDRHWIPPGVLSAPGEQNLALSQIVCQYDELGRFELFDELGNVEPIRCVRPREMQLAVVPSEDLRDSTNAMLRWKTQINPLVAGTAVDLPGPFRWESTIKQLEFFAHNFNNPVEVRRFAVQSRATIVSNRGQQETTIRFVEDPVGEDSPRSSDPVGIGFAIDVDGLVVRFQTPSDLVERLHENRAMLRCLRVSYFRDLVKSDPSLDGVANVFQRQWLSQVFLTALTNLAIQHQTTFEQCLHDLSQDAALLDLDSVLAVIFQSLAVSISAGSDSDDPDVANAEPLDDVQQQLQKDLEELLAQTLVRDCLHRHAEVLWQNPETSWQPWLSRKFKTTLGAAFLDAIQQVCRDLDASDLYLDVEAGPRPQATAPKPDDLDEIWITEKTTGGGGVIEAFLTRYGEDPRRFFDLVESTLRPSDYEIADQQLTILLSWIASPDESAIKQKITEFRSSAARSHLAHAQAFESLQKALSKRGLFTCHGVIAAIGNRILRPGSNENTDALLHRLIARWRQLEDDLDIEIDPRILAYHESDNNAIDDVIQDATGSLIETNRRQWRFNALFSLLWPRGGSARSARLAAYNPFDSLLETEHDLVRLALSGDPQRVSATEADWQEKLVEYLVRDSEVILQSAAEDLPQLRETLLEIITIPIDAGYMLLHPRVNRVDRRAENVEILLSLPEGIQ